MPIINHELWELWVSSNTDSAYGKKCVDTARRAMEILDECNEFNCDALLRKADEESEGATGITGFMEGAVARMISDCHSRGEEFRKAWNSTLQLKNEGDEATKKGKVLNPAILTFDIGTT